MFESPHEWFNLPPGTSKPYSFYKLLIFLEKGNKKTPQTILMLCKIRI